MCRNRKQHSKFSALKEYLYKLQYMSIYWLASSCQKRPRISTWLFSLHKTDKESSPFKNTEKISKKFQRTPCISMVFFLHQPYTTHWPHSIMHPGSSFLFPQTLQSELWFLCPFVWFGLNRLTQYRLSGLASLPQLVSRLLLFVTGLCSWGLVLSTVPLYRWP